MCDTSLPLGKIPSMLQERRGGCWLALHCWRYAAVLAALSLLGACAVQSQSAGMQMSQDNLQRFATAADQAAECRRSVAENPAYRLLRRHMPLTNVGSATLPQMAAAELATADEIVVLDAWASDLNACRERLLQEADSTFPTFGPIIEQGRNDDNAVFVMLARHDLTWGDAVMRLMSNRTKMRSDLIKGADQILSDLVRLQQAQLGRRTTIMSSIIRILP